jgi:cation:H+ antiporter
MNSADFRWLWDEHLLTELVSQLPVPLLLLIIAVCIATLFKGSDWLIDGVVDLARRFQIPKIVIGATVVSIGTTAPEAFVSVMAAYMGNPGLALGNGVGSIIADTGLIFGLTCLMARVPVNRFILNRTGWVQVGAATLLVLFSLAAVASGDEPPRLERWVGLVLVLLLFGYLYLSYRWAVQHENDRPELPPEESVLSLPRCWAMVFGGLALVIAAARIVVPTVGEIALRLGVPNDVIAATMVAFGTSLPELMTAIASVRKGHPEITVGNIVGADVLNCLFVIGTAALASPLEIPVNFFYFHFPAMLLILYSFRVFISVGHRETFRRWQGAWLLGIYIVYVVLQYALNIG